MFSVMLKLLHVALLLYSRELKVLIQNAELLRSIFGGLQKDKHDLQHSIREIDYSSDSRSSVK
jgi:hypothetical protein